MTQLIDLGKLRFNFSGDWVSSTQYETNDVVKYGGNAYVYTYGLKTSGNLPTNTTYWKLMVEGINFLGNWSSGTAYKIGDSVAYGGVTYIALADTTNESPDVTPLKWSKFVDGIQFAGAYNPATAYQPNDVVSYGGRTFIALATVTGVTPSIGSSWASFADGVRWTGAWTAATAYLPNDVVSNGVSTYIATQAHTSGSTFSVDFAAGKFAFFAKGAADILPVIESGQAGFAAHVAANGTDLVWLNATGSDNVFYVAPDGSDSNPGTSLALPFASIKHAVSAVPAGQAATIFVKTGTYNESALPIVIPANTAIVGDNQRTVVVQPAGGLAADGVTPNAESSMFLMSDGSILNKMTFRGMTGWVPGATAADVTTSTIKGVVVRLNPATPITHKSPYVLECSYIGVGGIGALIDGSVHATGAKTMIFHGYTIISDNGIGYWVKDGGKAEIVSCFTYYCYFGYTASGGGFIRALNGNNSYGTWGATSRGFDAGETPVTGALLGQQLNFLYQGGNINIGDTVTSSAGGTAIVTNAQTTANKVYVRNVTGSFSLGDTLTFTGGGVGTVSAGAVEDQKGFVLVMNNLTALPKPGQSIQIAGDSISYVVQSVTGTYANTSSQIVVVLAQEKPTGSPSGSVVNLRSLYSQIRLTGHDFLDIGTGGVATTNYPGTPTQPPAQGNEVDEAYPGRVYYVSTDQNGNFRVGEYFRIDQATGRATLNASAFDLAGLTSLRLGSIGAQLGETINEFSSDGTLSGNSNVAVPTEQAVKTYVDTGLVRAVPEQTFAAGEILFTDGVAPYWDSPTQISGQNTFSFVNGASFANRTYTATSLTTTSPTFVWSVSFDALPPGITDIAIDQSGVLSMTGTFTGNGSYSLTVNATDGRFVGRLHIRIYVAATASIPVFTTTASSVTGRTTPGTAVNITTFQATNTGGGITHAIVSGGVPPWLTLNASTGALTGTAPTLASSAREYVLTVSATAGGVTVLKTFRWLFTNAVPQGQSLFGVNTGPGTFSWVAPEGVTSVSVVAVGSGGWGGWQWSSGGQGGGGLGWKNNIPVVPGTSYTVQVANFGSNGGNSGSNSGATPSFFISEATVCGRSGREGNGGTFVGDGGGNGGQGGAGSWPTGGGGAGGYAGNGGNAATNNNAPAGGGGNGAYTQYSSTWGTGGGGGVGLLGQGPSASGWNPTSVGGAGGNGGSGGSAGTWGETGSYGNNSCRGGDYGGGGGGSGTSTSQNSPFSNQARGGHGGVRIIWGPNRAFPSTNTGDVAVVQ